MLDYDYLVGARTAPAAAPGEAPKWRAFMNPAFRGHNQIRRPGTDLFHTLPASMTRVAPGPGRKLERRRIPALRLSTGSFWCIATRSSSINSMIYVARHDRHGGGQQYQAGRLESCYACSAQRWRDIIRQDQLRGIPQPRAVGTPAALLGASMQQAAPERQDFNSDRGCALLQDRSAAGVHAGASGFPLHRPARQF